MKPDLVILGQILNETIKFADGRTLGPVLGGTLSYCSVAAARLGARVGIVAKIGRNTPRDLLQPILESGMDTAGLIREPAGYEDVLIYHPNGHKTLEFVARPSPLSLQDVPEEYRQADIIYCGSAMWEPPLAVVRALCRPGTRLAADLGGYGGAHHDVRHHTGGYDGYLRELLPYLHVAKASREDCTTLFTQTHLAPEEYAHLLVAWGAQVGIVTLGGEGAVVVTPDQVFKIPPLTNKAVDATGAGDVFSAGFLVHYRQHSDAWAAGLFASATAALVCERTGGVVLERMPTLPAVQARLSEYGESVQETRKS
jgi:sugar/nucleoside kinase (ribokinase family)